MNTENTLLGKAKEAFLAFIPISSKQSTKAQQKGLTMPEVKVEHTERPYKPGTRNKYNSVRRSPSATNNERNDRVEGFVGVEYMKDGVSIQFRGLLVPGTDDTESLRNRFIFLDKRAEPWFEAFCREIVDFQLNIPVRVRVSARAGSNRSFVMPCAKDRDQALREWGRLKEEIIGRPQNLSECRNTDQLCEFIYRKMAEDKNLKIVKILSATREALAVNAGNYVFRMSGAENIKNFTNGIESGRTTLETEIEKNCTCFRTYRI